MIKRYVGPVVLALVVLVALALIAWGYSYVSPYTPRAAREWSRGFVVGRTAAGQPVALQPAPGGGVLLLWPNPEGQLELAYIDVDGQVLFDRILAVSGGGARNPRMVAGADGRLHLIWREQADPNALIRYALVEADGTSAVRVAVLSDASLWVADAPAMAPSVLGGAHVVWADEEGLRWVEIGTDGAPERAPVLLVPGARAPALQIDDAGRLHLAWQEQLSGNMRAIYYATLDPATGRLSEIEPVAEIFRRTGQVIEGPALGLDANTGYVLWIVHDLRDGNSQARYAHFPLVLPRQRRIETLQPTEGVNPAGIAPLPGQNAPLRIALSEVVGSEWEATNQVAVLTLVGEGTSNFEIWGQGARRALAALMPAARPVDVEEEAERVVTRSRQPSLDPTLAIDGRGYLHLAWLEPGGMQEYRVVYASTAPDVNATYNAITLWDVVDPALGAAFRLTLIVLAVGPMVVLWVLLPMSVLVLYHMVTGEEGLETTRSRLILAVVIVLEVFLTLVVPPFQLTRWPLLRWGAPLITALIASVVALISLRRSWNSPLFEVFFVFTGVHTLLQLVIYYIL